jgi:hypothetical protein
LNNNNRNNRRRGRGNRSQGGGNGSQLNRIDSRARGNAPQMLDKYKKLAQDAQHNGDRVQMEYYLQFADHYFRVIADNKARQDEQRGPGAQGRRNDERDQNDDYGDDDLDFDRGRRSEQASRPRYDDQHNSARVDFEEGEPGQEGEPFLTDDRDDDRSERQPRQQEARRQQRKPRDGNRDGNRSERPARAERPVVAERDDSAEPPRSEKRVEKPVRARRPRKVADDGPAGLDSSILPPSIRGDDAGGDSGALETVD